MARHITGCRNRSWLDVHHLDPRAEGGQHDPERMTVLCGTHHKALHRGLLILSGSVSTGLRFHHPDGTDYGAAIGPGDIEASELAFGALRRLGFGETEARRRLSRARAHVGHVADLATLLQQALALG